jgi:hypothetical protein
LNRSHPIARILLALVFAAPLAAHAATLNVPADFPTIQGAIDAALDGDEIVVAPGTYVEVLRVDRKNLSLRSSGGKEVTILDGNAAGTVFTLTGIVQSSYTNHYAVTLDGFTFRNGNGGWGGGIYAQYHCELTVKNSLVTGNVAGNGGGIAANLDAWVTVTDTVVTGNTASYAGGGTFGYVGGVSVTRGAVSNNIAGSYGGGGAGLYYCGSVHFQDTVVTGNSAQVGGGLFAAFDSACNSSFGLSNVVVTKNTASVRGGGAAMMNGPIVSSWITQSTFTENVAPEGAGWWNDATTNFAIQNSIFWNNSTPPIFTPKAGGSNTIGYSVLEGDPASTVGLIGDGTNVFFADPLFVNPAAGDYHLQSSSPAINVGLAGAIGWAPGPTATDITGMARQGAPDAGAYEYDNVAPTVAVTLSGTQGLNGWYVSGVTADVLAVDSGVGVASVSFRLPDSASTVPGDAVSLSITADGPTSLITWAADKNGTPSDEQITPIQIDQTAPVVTAQVIGTAGTNGWYRSAVTVALAATDATSGVAAITYAVDAAPATEVAAATATVAVGETAGTTLRFGAADNAGNASAAELTVKVDTTAPALTLGVSPATIKNNNKSYAVSITGTATDALSGVASTSVNVTNLKGAVVATSTLGGTVNLIGTKGEKYTITATSTDRAGNAAVQSATVTVVQ